MKKAIELAKEAFEKDLVPVGAILVYQNKIIAAAHNGMNPIDHAEVLVLREGFEKIGKNIDKASLYVTLEPCLMCCGAIAWAHIKTVYFGAYDVKCGAIDHGPRAFQHSQYQPEIFGGINEKQCGLLLKNFFKEKR